MTLRPVVLSGGSGKRLWPLSSSRHPKQLQALVDERPMLVATLDRLHGIDSGAPIVVCGADHAVAVRELLEGRDALVVAEPMGRSTAPALAVAAMLAEPDDVLLVLPADHVVANPAALVESIAEGVALASAGHVVAFGVVADRPATGYGWIRPGAPVGGGAGRRVDAFTEKPDAAAAARHLADGLLWNAGMFCVSASVYLDELGRHRPDVLEATRVSLREGGLDAEAFALVPAVSVDVAVMEPTDRAVVVLLDAGWSDVGSWDSLWDVLPKDAHGNAVDGMVVTRGTTGSLVWAASRTVVVVGMDDVVVVETPEAVLVVPRSMAESVKDVVESLPPEGSPDGG